MYLYMRKYRVVQPYLMSSIADKCIDVYLVSGTERLYLILTKLWRNYGQQPSSTTPSWGWDIS